MEDPGAGAKPAAAYAALALKGLSKFLSCGWQSRVRHHPTRGTKRKPTLQTEGGPPFVIIQFVEGWRNWNSKPL